MGKIRFARNTRRFAEVVHAPCVYAVELSNGIVKVGASSSARGRMMSLQAQVKRAYRAELGRFFIMPRATVKAAYEFETLAVHRLEQLAEPIPGRREFFAGIGFDEAVRVLRSVARATRSLPKIQHKARV